MCQCLCTCECSREGIQCWLTCWKWLRVQSLVGRRWQMEPVQAIQSNISSLMCQTEEVKMCYCYSAMASFPGLGRLTCYVAELVSYSYGKMICVGYHKLVPTFPPNLTLGRFAYCKWSNSGGGDGLGRRLTQLQNELVYQGYETWGAGNLATQTLLLLCQFLRPSHTTGYVLWANTSNWVVSRMGGSLFPSNTFH